jgi:hypothetical protein
MHPIQDLFFLESFHIYYNMICIFLYAFLFAQNFILEKKVGVTHPVPGWPLQRRGGTAVGSAREAPHPPHSPPRSSSRPPARVPAQPPISRAHRPGLVPRLRARRRAHHWCMGMATLLASRGGMTPPPSCTPSYLVWRCGSGDLDLGQAGGGAQGASRLGRPRQAGGGARRQTWPRVWTAGSASTASSLMSPTAVSRARICFWEFFCFWKSLFHVDWHKQPTSSCNFLHRSVTADTKKTHFLYHRNCVSCGARYKKTLCSQHYKVIL